MSLTPYSINVTWNETTNGTVNGELFVYYVFFREIKGSPSHWDNFATSNISLTLVNLKPGTLYGLRMTVAILDGNGIASEELEIETIEGGGYNNDYFSLFIQCSLVMKIFIVDLYGAKARDCSLRVWLELLVLSFELQYKACIFFNHLNSSFEILTQFHFLFHAVS